jgi:hypothetical protein
VEQPGQCTGDVCRLASAVLLVATALVQPEEAAVMDAMGRAGLLAAIMDFFSTAGECRPSLLLAPGACPWCVHGGVWCVMCACIVCTIVC